MLIRSGNCRNGTDRLSPGETPVWPKLTGCERLEAPGLTDWRDNRVISSLLKRTTPHVFPRPSVLLALNPLTEKKMLAMTYAATADSATGMTGELMYVSLAGSV